MGVRRPLPERDLDHVLEHTEHLWNELRGERLFVTGGTGFFGGWMLESLLHAERRLRLGASATVLTRDPDAYRDAVPHVATHPAISLWPGDVRSCKQPPGEFSHLLHLATETRLDEDPAASFKTAVHGAERICELATAAATRRLLLASSGAVYGRQPPDLQQIDESFTGAPAIDDPGTSYGQGKRAAEFLCVAASSASMEVKIARGFAFVGPLLPINANFAIGNFIRDALAGGPVQVAGDGSPRRSYLYAADLAIWLWTILLRGMPGRPYNVGSDQAVSIAELAHQVRDLVHPDAPVVVGQAKQPGGAPSRYVPSIERARSELGLAPWVSLPDGILRTADWYSVGPMRDGGVARRSVS